MTSSDRRYSAFVIRIWWEPAPATDDGQPAWRGWVQHVRSGEISYVRDWEELLRFIERWIGGLSDVGEPSVRLK
ncbi:MAG: hypothetical protein GXP39_13630 [Chloroflexi bacterium]|nr:hypothetical protein [Chloroflexota bacterium]